MFLTVIAGIMLFLTRPEGVAYAGASLLVLIYRSLSPRFGGVRVVAVGVGAMVIFLLSGAYVLTQNKVIREAVLSNNQLAMGIRGGSQEHPSDPIIFEKQLSETYATCSTQAAADPEKRKASYWCSVIGIENIKKDPLNYLLVLTKSFPNLLFPSFYRDGMSWKYKLAERTIMSFIIAGVICVFMFRSKEKFEATGLAFVALTGYICINFILNEWDVRVQLSPQVLLLPVASLGWIMLANRVYEKFQLEIKS